MRCLGSSTLLALLCLISSADAQELERIRSAQKLVDNCKQHYSYMTLGERSKSEEEINQAQNCYNIVEIALDALKAANGMNVGKVRDPIFCSDTEINTSSLIKKMVTQDTSGLYVPSRAGDMISYLLVSNYPCN